MCTNGRGFRQATGCILSIMSSTDCHRIRCTSGHAYFALMQHLSEHNRVIHKISILHISCRNILSGTFGNVALAWMAGMLGVPKLATPGFEGGLARHVCFMRDSMYERMMF